jgi:Cu+-exporting ATPase
LNHPPDAKSSRAVFRVRDISCSVCGLAIEKQVKKLEGVNGVRTAVMLNKVFVDFDPSKIDLDRIKKAVDKTGYGTYTTLTER